MSKSLKIKEEFRSTVVGYNHSGLPLGERSDLHILAEMAKHDPYLANMFEDLPTDEEIVYIKEEAFLETHPAEPEMPQEPSTNIIPADIEETGGDAE